MQQLGEQLIGLADADLGRLPLDERLLDAVYAAKRIKSRGALRRQKQLIGKLMRNVDAGPIREGLARILARAQADKRIFAESEKWRDRIVDEGQDAVVAFRQHTGSRQDSLDELVTDLGRAAGDKARKTLRRRIFRAVNDVLVAKQQDDRIS